MAGSSSSFRLSSPLGGGRLSLLLLLMLLAGALYLLVELTSTNSEYANIVGGANGIENEISYGIIIDAGSTGSRLFLYYWRATSENELIDIKPALDQKNEPVVKKVFPGLSTFADTPEQAAEYIKPLLDYAVEYVPEENRPYTPVFILATAGMRLVPDEKQKAILKDLHTKLPKLSNMQIMKEHIRVIEGKWEGIYSWIAVNYILGKFASSHATSSEMPPRSQPSLLSRMLKNEKEEETPLSTVSSPVRQATVGMIDMGGASAQIAFEMPSNDTFRSENVENVNLGCRDDDPQFKFTLYVTTFLGYGVNEGLRKYEQFLSDELKQSNGTYVKDACLPINLQKEVTREDKTIFMRRGVGNWTMCMERLSDLITTTDRPSPRCLHEACYFGGVAAPSANLSTMQIYGFSEYWFSAEDVLGIGGPYNYSTFSEKAGAFCSQRWSTIQSHVRQKLYAKASEERLRSQCFKSAWVSSVLHSGFNVDKQHNHFRSAFTIAGQEVQWALGAMIYNMRYFPLRVSQRRRVQETASKHRYSSAQIAEVLAVVAFLSALVFTALRCFARRMTPSQPGMRRNPSMWTYMMIQEDRYLPKVTSFRAPSLA